MIVPMKKATVIIQQKDSWSALDELRALGFLHIEHQNPAQSQDINVLRDNLTLLDNCLAIISQAAENKKKAMQEPEIPDGWKLKARHIIDLAKRRDQLESFARNLRQQISDWEAWGDFSPEKILQLAEKGVYLRLYHVPLRQIKDFPQGVFVSPLFTRSGFGYCVVVSLAKFDCPFKEIVLPKQGLLAMRLRLVEEERVIKELGYDIDRNLRLAAAFLRERKRLEKEIEFLQAIAGMGSTGTLSYVTGYIPFDAVDKLFSQAKIKQWGIVISEPSDDEDVPVLLRSGRFFRLMQPVFKLLEIVPGYHELDISPVFLIFLSLFFGMLIGDAGYGAVYFILTFWLHKKLGKKIRDKSAFFLFYLLSFCAIIWGLLTGTFFGQAWLMHSGLKPLLPGLNNAQIAQRFCFFLGALQLTIAHSWRIAVKLPSLTALADFGWIGVLWTAFFLANTLILGDIFPGFGILMVSISIALVVLFSNPQKNILKCIGSGLGTVALSLMNNFTDVVSYVRLFAVGLAGVAIADTFNAMAGNVGRGSFFALILSAIIIIMGHALNLVLGPMSVIVHGIRLNVLEFSGHASVSWSGRPYQPLKKD
ncbi:MAG: hypothetical protein MUC39_00100 [Candidatus Omnitrophica bacterium]|jgi:V/A-type H+-transporting ATPase subunit I|nr:hypothetical protein [Candidatus Omnitrophota bacterium]